MQGSTPAYRPRGHILSALVVFLTVLIAAMGFGGSLNGERVLASVPLGGTQAAGPASTTGRQPMSEPPDPRLIDVGFSPSSPQPGTTLTLLYTVTSQSVQNVSLGAGIKVSGCGDFFYDPAHDITVTLSVGNNVVSRLFTLPNVSNRSYDIRWALWSPGFVTLYGEVVRNGAVTVGGPTATPSVPRIEDMTVQPVTAVQGSTVALTYTVYSPIAQQIGLGADMAPEGTNQFVPDQANDRVVSAVAGTNVLTRTFNLADRPAGFYSVRGGLWDASFTTNYDLLVRSGVFTIWQPPGTGTPAVSPTPRDTPTATATENMCSTPTPNVTATRIANTPTPTNTSVSFNSPTPRSTGVATSTPTTTPTHLSSDTPTSTPIGGSTATPRGGTPTNTPVGGSTSTPVGGTPTHTPIGGSTATPGGGTPTNSPTGSRTAVFTATHTGTPGGNTSQTPGRTPSALPSRTAVGTPPANCAMTFVDVQSTDYFYEAVRYLYCSGAISGYADTTFRPYNNTTRGQLSKIVVLAEGWGIYTPASPTFGDVPSGSPFYPYVETAYSHGIISGYLCGPGCLEFRPGNNVTRGQLAKIIVLAQDWSVGQSQQPTFRDVPPTDPFYGYIEAAYAHGAVSGYSCGATCLEFRPANYATRGQISKIVYNAIAQP